MSDHTEQIEFSDQDLEDLRSLGVSDGEAPDFHPILEVWREVLKPAHDAVKEKVTPQWANKMVSSYQGLTYADMAEVHESYFDKLFQLENILLQEIASDDQCLTYTTPEEDVEHNGYHYRNLLLNWQLAFMQWELDWSCTDINAAAELAAMSEIHKIMFSREGITAFLDQIRFEYDEQDQAQLAQALQELKEGQ